MQVTAEEVTFCLLAGERESERAAHQPETRPAASSGDIPGKKAVMKSESRYLLAVSTSSSFFFNLGRAS